MNSYLFIFSACYSDYFYQARSSIRYTVHGGTPGSGTGCGAFFVSAYSDASSTNFNRGAALSFKPAGDSGSRRFIAIIFIQVQVLDILIAVVPRAMVLSVVRFMFVLTLVPLVSTGVVAPPYHLNLYRVIIFIKIEVMIDMLIVVAARVLVPAVELSVLVLLLVHLALHGILAPPYHLNQLDDSVRGRRFIVIIFIKLPLQDILLVVVPQTLVLNVGLFVFMLPLVPLLLIGTVAQPYHLNQIIAILVPDVL